MYSINNFFPFIDRADFVRNIREVHNISEFFGFEVTKTDFDVDTKGDSHVLKAYRVLPSNTLFLMEVPSVVKDVFNGIYGQEVTVDIIELDYQGISNSINCEEVNDSLCATLYCNGGFDSENIITDTFINACGNGIEVPYDVAKDFLILEDSDRKSRDVNINDWLYDNEHIDESYIMESAADTLQLLKDRRKNGKDNYAEEVKGKDAIYTWLDAYFSLPEGEEIKSGGREVVPLLIGPTAVFKSATIKELCKKYNYRMVDFRVAFTSRLDYSGLFQIGEVEGKKYSYACPMEELVVCSDGFREFCKQSYQKLEDILQKGYIEKDVASDGNVVEKEQQTISDEQREKIVKLQLQYKEYMKTPVLFFDEITRCSNKGVNGILVQLLNQKRLNDMTFNGCKFVAATNLDIQKGLEREEYKMELETLYDVNTDLDVAYSNRFIPLKVYPEDVQDRWFEWAKSLTSKKGFTDTPNIHPVVLEFLEKNRDYVYNDKPVIDAIANGLSDNEQRTAVFPNYRTWDMLSEYLYSIDESASIDNDDKDGAEEKLYKRRLVEGYISKWCCDKFLPFLESKGYKEYDSVKEPVEDTVSDFLDTALENNSPAMLIGPSSLGKCVTGDTIIRVDGGITEIKSLEFTDGYLEREYIVDGLTDYVTTSHTYREVCDEVVAIKDNYGSVIKVTKNHPLRVLSKDGVVWKKALDIKEGDVLLSKKFDSSYFKDIKHDFNAYMYGFVLGDGCVSNKAKGCNSLTLSYNKERIVTLLNENGFIEDTTKRTRSDNFRSALRDSGKIYRLYKEFPREGRNLKKELWEIGVYNYTWGDVDKEHFPRSGSYEYILNVLAGYIDTDGYIAHSGDCGYVEFCCKSESLISDLQDVLSSLGLKAYRGKDRYNKGYDRYYPRLRLNARDSVELMLLIKDLLVLKHEQAEELISKFSGNTRQGKLDIPLECGSVLRDEINFLIKVCFESKGMTRTQYKNLKTGYFCNDLDRHRTSIDSILSFIEDNKLEREFVAYPLWDEFKTISYLRNCNVSTVVSVEEIGTHVVYDVTIPKTHTFIANGFISHNTSRVKAYMKKVKLRTGLEPVLINVNLASKDAVDLMGMPVKQSLTEYVGGGILKGSGLEEVSKELQSIVKSVSSDIKYGMTDLLTLRAPDKTVKDRFITALKEGREVILFFDEVNRVQSSTVTSAVFEAVSDSRFGGVDFSEYKDRVKIIAACNMAWEGMEEDGGGYGDTGTLDPAFAARFSIYWKKEYDEQDVKSWISFMESEREDGTIDGTLLDFFKDLDTKQALKIMASVEKRTLEDAQPSTRNMLQLSKDIKSMRGRNTSKGFMPKAFNGKILFTDDVQAQYENLVFDRQSNSLEVQVQKTIKFIDSLLYGKDLWESLLINDSVKVGGTSISASDIVDSLEACSLDLKQYNLKAMSSDDRDECSNTLDLVQDLADFIRSLDIKTSNKREDIFKMYLGESILGEFTKYFNNTFGTGLDEDITIEQLKDDTLIIPYMKLVQRNFSKFSGNTEKIVNYCLGLCKDFMDIHGTYLPNKNYAMFLSGIKDILPNADNMVLFLRLSGEDIEKMYEMAEAVGDDWIIDITSDYGTRVTKEYIDNIRKLISDSKKTKKSISKSKFTVL